MSHWADLKSFDGLDNRREMMSLLQRLGSDQRRAEFIKSLVPWSRLGFASCPAVVDGPCDPVAAYFMLVSTCNELGVSINDAMRKLETEVRCSHAGQPFVQPE